MESYLSLVRGNRLSSYLGLKMDEEVPYRFHDNYTHIMVPAARIVLASGEDEGQEVVSGKRNQRVRIEAACTVTPRGASSIALVEPNPALSTFGDVQASYHVHIGTHTRPEVHITLRKDLKLSEIEYLVRIYLHG